MTWLWIVIGIVVVLLLLLVYLFNRIVRLRNEVTRAGRTSTCS